MSEQACVQDMRPQFRLRTGQDDLLIQWLMSFAPRQRSRAIRDALLRYLEGRDAQTRERGWDEDPDLAAALDTLF
jgi:hypothetical protein